MYGFYSFLLPVSKRICSQLIFHKIIQRNIFFVIDINGRALDLREMNHEIFFFYLLCLSNYCVWLLLELKMGIRFQS